MRGATVIVAGLCLAAAVAPAVACGGGPGAPAPLPAAERAWRGRVAESFAGRPRVPAARAAALERRLRQRVVAGGGQVVRLVVRRGPELAPELVIRASDPAGYLEHALPGVLHGMPSGWVYLAVQDAQGRRVFEWSIASRPPLGSLFVRADLRGCGPIRAFGWTSPLPACPSG